MYLFLLIGYVFDFYFFFFLLILFFCRILPTISPAVTDAVEERDVVAGVGLGSGGAIAALVGLSLSDDEDDDEDDEAEDSDICPIMDID